MVIAPKVFPTPDRPIIRFKQAKEKIDLDKEIKRVLRSQGWGLGTYFNVQFVNHDETELFSQAEYVVSKDREEFQTNDDNDYNPSSRTVHVREATLVGGDGVEAASREALPTVIAGLDTLDEKIVEVLGDVSACNEQIDGLNNRVKVLEEKPKRGRPPAKPEE